MFSSGIIPCEFNVVVLPDPVEEKTKGGLILSDETRERNKHSATKATLVALSPMAFDESIWPVGVAKPEPGARVLIAKHAGTFCDGADGQEYRIVKDKDVVALIEDEA